MKADKREETREEREQRINQFRSLPPVLSKDGKTYCSPWCGHQCTKAAFDRANQMASQVRDYLGEGWKVNVWENMGWFWEVSNACVSVGPADSYKPIITGYKARLTLNPDSHDGVNGLPQFFVDDLDPRKAVETAMKQCDKWIASVLRERAKITLGWRNG